MDPWLSQFLNIPPNTDIPLGIDPGNAFRIIVKCEKFKAVLEYYSTVDMEEQWFDLWIDRSSGYNLDSFVTDMASKIIWGPSQTLAVWSVDTDSEAKWKVRRNEHFQKMISSRWNDRVANVVVEVVEKGYQLEQHEENREGSVTSSGVTSKAFSSNALADQAVQENLENEIVDWDSLIILPEPDQDSEATVLADEDRVFEALGLKDVDENADENGEKAADSEHPIPVISEEMEQDMADAGFSVDDSDPSEPVIDWDRDNPEMSVGSSYPSMVDFRLAVRQHAIVNEFELGTEKSDKSRFRGYCKASGCPWVIRARTQADGCVRVHLLTTPYHMTPKKKGATKKEVIFMQQHSRM